MIRLPKSTKHKDETCSSDICEHISVAKLQTEMNLVGIAKFSTMKNVCLSHYISPYNIQN